MSANLYLPEKKEIDYEYILDPGVYTWVAPDKNRNGTSYIVEVALFGGGSGVVQFRESGGTNVPLAYGKGNTGGYIEGELTVIPGQSYTLTVGSGTPFNDSNLSSNAGFTFITDSIGDIVQAGGGPGRAFTIVDDPNTLSPSVSGVTIIDQPSKFTAKFTSGTQSRNINGSGKYGIFSRDGDRNRINVATPAVDVTETGGVGGNDVTGFNGSNGKLVLRYGLKPNTTNNVPV